MEEMIPNKPPGLVTDPFTRPPVFPESPLVGSSNVGAGVTGNSAGQAGVSGTSVPRPLPPAEVGLLPAPLAGDGVQGTGENGVHGMSASAMNSGVLGENSSKGAGVMGTSVAGFGLHGRNTSPVFPNLVGAPPPPPPSAASSVNATDCGVFGESLGFEGVFGVSEFQHGVHGVSATVSGSKPAHPCGVWGESSAGYGVCATSDSTNGLWASSNSDHGVLGQTSSQSHAGVYGWTGAGSGSKPVHPCGVWGESSAGYGVCATSDSTNGLWASSNSDHGVLGQTSSQSHAGVYGWTGAGSGKAPKQGVGVWGDSDQGIGVYGASKSGNAGQFDGNVTVTGNHTVTGNVTANDVALGGMDCAEDFDVADKMRLEPGTVVVFDDEGAIRESQEPYNKRVAGVISGAGKYRPGVILGREGSSDDGKAPVALMGRVYCKVDAEFTPIGVGDLLTTSPTPGHAMRTADPNRAFGAVIGKALAGLKAGRGLIPILVALQ
jgi:hypothetical protein